MRHRWAVLAGSLLFLACGGFLFTQLRQQFFPKDLSYLSYVDVWLPEDAPFAVTNAVVARLRMQERAQLTNLSKRRTRGAKRCTSPCSTPALCACVPS
jgi:multidrug efflux pump subunit AcrB